MNDADNQCRINYFVDASLDVGVAVVLVLWFDEGQTARINLTEDQLKELEKVLQVTRH